MPDANVPDIELGADELDFLMGVVSDSFRKQHEAAAVLRYLDWPPNRIPMFDYTFAEAWNDVFSEIRRGRIPSGFRRLLTYVRDRYPGNAELQTLASRHLSTDYAAAEYVDSGPTEPTLSVDVWDTYYRQLVDTGSAASTGLLSTGSREEVSRARAELAARKTTGDDPDGAISGRSTSSTPWTVRSRPRSH